MILVKPSATIEMITPNALSLIERSGRTCYKSEDKIGCTVVEDHACLRGLNCKDCEHLSANKFIKMIINRGHETVLEHASATVRFIVDRGVSHELVRHRIASFSQESTRYCDYEKGHVAFVIPPWVEGVEPRMYEDFHEMWGEDLNKAEFIAKVEWFDQMIHSEVTYKRLRENGWKPEQARSVLPNSLKTEVVMTANFREWRLILKQRTSKFAHPSMIEVMKPLLQKFKKEIPVIFDDIEC